MSRLVRLATPGPYPGDRGDNHPSLAGRPGSLQSQGSRSAFVQHTNRRGESGMITVAILINGQPIMARSATNKSDENDKGETRYLVDDGSVVWLDPEKGASPLGFTWLQTTK